MIIKSVSIENFRNIRSAEIEFSRGVNILHGGNAQGKTNILEALSVCAGGRSFKGAKPSAFIPFGTGERTRIALDFTKGNSDKVYNIEYTYIPGNPPHITMNGMSFTNSEYLYGEVKYAMFVPEHLGIVKGAPETRRGYLDSASVMLTSVHRDVLMKYRAALKHCNALLYDCRSCFNKVCTIPALTMPAFSPESECRSVMRAYLEQLARQGINLMYGRLKYVSYLQEIMKRLYGEISKGTEKLTAIYKSDIFGEVEPDVFFDKLKKDKVNVLDAYLRHISTLNLRNFQFRGAHRDDVKFLLDGADSREYASQGQSRSIALVLKLAEAEVIRAVGGDTPAVFLDEVLSELDNGRREFVLKHFGESQAIITTCNDGDYKKITNAALFRVENGHVEHGTAGV